MLGFGLSGIDIGGDVSNGMIFINHRKANLNSNVSCFLTSFKKEPVLACWFFFIAMK